MVGEKNKGGAIPSFIDVFSLDETKRIKNSQQCLMGAHCSQSWNSFRICVLFMRGWETTAEILKHLVCSE